MSLWKSRWSWVRLVNSAAAKRAPPTRPSARACEETSIAQAGVEHRPQVALQIQSFRRRALNRAFASADDRRDGPQETRLGPAGLEQRPDQVRRRGLAVGPRHAEQLEPRGGSAVELVGDRTHRTADGRHDELRRVEVELALDDQRRRPGGERLRRVACAVHVEAADAEEERSGLHLPAVVGEGAHFGVGRQPAGGRGCEIAQPHRVPSVSRIRRKV
jgi:hypothetical protein